MSDATPAKSRPKIARPMRPDGEAEARRVAIPIAVAITAFLAFLMLTGILTDKSKAVYRDSTLELVLSVLTYVGFLAAIVWGVWSAFRGKGREWRESKARSVSARVRLAGQRARPREGDEEDDPWFGDHVTWTLSDPSIGHLSRMTGDHVFYYADRAPDATEKDFVQTVYCKYEGPVFNHHTRQKIHHLAARRP